MSVTPIVDQPCMAFLIMDGEPTYCERAMGHSSHHGAIGHDDTGTAFALQWAVVDPDGAA